LALLAIPLKLMNIYHYISLINLQCAHIVRAQFAMLSGNWLLMVNLLLLA
jgi:hypothetical protein